MDCLAGAFIFMVINGFLLFFISLNSLFISYGVLGFSTLIGRTIICDGFTGTLSGKFTLIACAATAADTVAGFGFTSTVGI